MQHPLSKEYKENNSNDLVRKAIDGNSEALSEIIKIHQPFIYNVAWKMCHDPNDAEDLTQEVLIKIITKLAQFSFRSSFRTWLYRIVVNEFLQTKRRKGETQFSSFEDYGNKLDNVPNTDLTIEEELSQRTAITLHFGRKFWDRS
jgi:RNA polymerase sigma factor (sigma-70 family)